MSELDKMLAVKDKSQAIGEFLEWLRYKKMLVLASYRNLDDDLCPESQSTEELLAEYFGIDLQKAEQEKRAILDQLRENTCTPKT